MSISIGLVGLGQFGSGFSGLFARHPLVSRIALCDVDGAKVAARAKVLATEAPGKVSPDDCFTDFDKLLRARLDALVIITQQWLHADQCLQALEHGSSVWSAVPLLMVPDTGVILDACDRLVRAVQRTGRHYMLAETTYYRAETMFCRRQARAGRFGAFVASEGEYDHSFDVPGCDLRKVMSARLQGEVGATWKRQLAQAIPAGQGLGPMLYPTHSLCGPMSVMRSRPVKVSCFGQKPVTSDPYFHDMGEVYSNQTALFQMSNGSTMRICEHRETAQHRDAFRITGTDAYYTQHGYWHDAREPSRSRNYTPEEMRDPLPADVLRAFLGIDAAQEHPAAGYANDFSAALGAHGGSHPYLVHEFVSSVHEDRQPAIPIWEAVRYMAAGVMAHRSAMRDGECLTIPDWGDAPQA